MNQQEKKELLEGIYKNMFNSDNGKIIIKDIENFILTANPFYSDDIQTDALLRDGARHLLNYMKAQININND